MVKDKNGTMARGQNWTAAPTPALAETLGLDGGLLQTEISTPAATGKPPGRDTVTPHLFPSQMLKTGGRTKADDNGPRSRAAAVGKPDGRRRLSPRPAPGAAAEGTAGNVPTEPGTFPKQQVEASLESQGNPNRRSSDDEYITSTNHSLDTIIAGRLHVWHQNAHTHCDACSSRQATASAWRSCILLNQDHHLAFRDPAVAPRVASSGHGNLEHVSNHLGEPLEGVGQRHLELDDWPT